MKPTLKYEGETGTIPADEVARRIQKMRDKARERGDDSSDDQALVLALLAITSSTCEGFLEDVGAFDPFMLVYKADGTVDIIALRIGVETGGDQLSPGLFAATFDTPQEAWVYAQELEATIERANDKHTHYEYGQELLRQVQRPRVIIYAAHSVGNLSLSLGNGQRSNTVGNVETVLLHLETPDNKRSFILPVDQDGEARSLARPKGVIDEGAPWFGIYKGGDYATRTFERD